MRRPICAYSFRSPLSLAEVFDELSRSSPWRWVWRDNDSWGDYISAGALGKPHFGVVKILREDGQSLFNVLLNVDSDDKSVAAELFGGLREIILRELLPSIQASEIVSIEVPER